MLGALAIINTVLAAAILVVFVLLAKRTKTTMRFVYLGGCCLMAYIILLYGHLFVTGYPLGVEWTRPSTGFLLALLLSVGIHELYRH